MWSPTIRKRQTPRIRARAVEELTSDKDERQVRMEMIKEQPNHWPVARIIAVIMPYCEWSEVVVACIDYFEANKDQMRCNLSRKRRSPAGSGIAASASEQIVRSRFKRLGYRWLNAGTNSLLTVNSCIASNRWGNLPGRLVKDLKIHPICGHDANHSYEHQQNLLGRSKINKNSEPDSRIIEHLHFCTSTQRNRLFNLPEKHDNY